MRNIWFTLAQNLARKVPTTLMIVVESLGSAPGKLGFKMWVSAEREQEGTIGGGIMEHQLVEEAINMARAQQPSVQLMSRIHRENAPQHERSGMICAGSQKIIMQVFQPQAPELARLLAAVEAGNGLLQISPDGWHIKEQPIAEARPHFQQADGNWTWSEPLGAHEVVYVIGGGHVGLALCQVLALTDFRIVNIDHRPEVATFKGNTVAHQKICSHYEEMGPHLQEGHHAYAVVVTTSFSSDAAALKLLATKKMRFIGLMGSATKIRRIKALLRESGVLDNWLKQIYAPVGLPIANRTPAEIAISIAAQLILVRNGS